MPVQCSMTPKVTAQADFLQKYQSHDKSGDFRVFKLVSSSYQPQRYGLPIASPAAARMDCAYPCDLGADVCTKRHSLLIIVSLDE